MKTTLLPIAIVVIALVAIAVFMAAFLLFASKGTIEQDWLMGILGINEEGETIHHEEMSSRIIYGNISEIGKDYITIKDLRLNITERTRVYENGKEISIDDLRVGDHVRVNYTDNFEAFSIYKEGMRE